MIIEEKLKERKLPALMEGCPGADPADEWARRRPELVKILGHEVFGFAPQWLAAVPTHVESQGVDREYTWAGKAFTERLELVIELPGEPYRVPFLFHRPFGEGKKPAVLHIAFRTGCPDRYLPVEEILDRGYALVQFCYQDATPDIRFDDYSQGLAGRLIEKPRDPERFGSIGIWAYTASRIMDWLVTRDDIDPETVSVSGHSRLAKTALWCMAQDERFFACFANCPGYAGSGLIRGKVGEDLEAFFRGGSYVWFCENYGAYRGRSEYDLPYDMHFLVAAAAPRKVFVNCAEIDACKDVNSEFLSCAAASEAWERLGRPGLVTPDALPLPGGPTLLSGDLGFAARHGTHYLGREDWNRFLDFMDAKLGRA